MEEGAGMSWGWGGANISCCGKKEVRVQHNENARGKATDD